MLHDIGMENSVISLFRDAKIDGSALVLMSDGDLRALGVTSGHRQDALEEIKKLQHLMQACDGGARDQAMMFEMHPTFVEISPSAEISLGSFDVGSHHEHTECEISVTLSCADSIHSSNRNAESIDVDGMCQPLD